MVISFLLTVSLIGLSSSPFSFLSSQALLFNFLKNILLLPLKIRAFFDSLGVRQLGFLSGKGLLVAACGRRRLSGICVASACARRKGCWDCRWVPRPALAGLMAAAAANLTLCTGSLFSRPTQTLYQADRIQLLEL